MYRKTALLAAALLASFACLAGSPTSRVVSPFQYANRWYIALQGGPMTTFSDNRASYTANGQGWDLLRWHAAASLGYNFSDAFDLRVCGSYSRNAGALEPYGGFYPYRYNAAQLFADAVLNFKALGEYYTAFSPKAYLGIGAAYTAGANTPRHPYQLVEGPNLVPGLRLGLILERDCPGGFGWFVDFGTEFFYGWYDGLEPNGFALDTNLKLSFGVVYHFQRAKK